MHNQLIIDKKPSLGKNGRCLAVYISGKVHDSIALDAAGVIGDGHYGKDPERSVMLTSTLAYDMAAQKGIYLEGGTLEENILVDLDPYDLPIGTQISIGEAIVEISKYGTICSHLTHIDSRLPKLLKEKRGIFAKVIREGSVKAGDAVRVLF